mgnify:CR=1 FL=1
MKEQTFYAIINNGHKKYQGQLRCELLEAQLPIFWNKSVAKDYLKKHGLTERSSIVKVAIIERS